MSQISENKQRIIKNTLYLYARMLVLMIIGLFTSRVILNSLGEVDFGLINVVGGITAMFGFLNGCLGAATSRFITFELGRNDYVALNKVFNAALVVHIMIGIIIVILGETVGLWFFYNKMVIPDERLGASMFVYQLSVLGTPIFLSQVPYNATLIAHENMKIYAYFTLVDGIFKLVNAYLIFISPMDKMVFYASLTFIESIACLVFYRIYCIRHYSETSIKICKDKKLYKNMFSYAGSDLIGQIAGLAQGEGLNLLLNTFFGPVVNAARGIAYQVQGHVSKFSGGFMTAVKPQIIKSYAAGDIDGMLKLVKQGACFSFYLMLMIALPVCLESKQLLTWWLGKYPAHTESFLILIIIFCLINTWKESRGTALHATGKLLLSNVTVGICMCLAFPISYIFLKLGGVPESVFVAAIISIFLSDIIGVFVLRHYVRFSIPNYLLSVHVRCICVAVLACSVSYFVYDKILEPGVFRVILNAVISIIMVGVASITIGMDKSMRNKMVSIVAHKFTRIKDKFYK